MAVLESMVLMHFRLFSIESIFQRSRSTREPFASHEPKPRSTGKIGFMRLLEENHRQAMVQPYARSASDHEKSSFAKIQGRASDLGQEEHRRCHRITWKNCHSQQGMARAILIPFPGHPI